MSTTCLATKFLEPNSTTFTLPRTVLEPWPSNWHAGWSFLDVEFLSYVPGHWLTFAPAPMTSHFLLATLYGLAFIPGCLGNLLVLGLFARWRSELMWSKVDISKGSNDKLDVLLHSAHHLRGPSNTIAINLTISDLMMNLLIPFFIHNSLVGKPATGILGCELYGFAGGLSGTAAIMSQCAMAVERYFTIVYPFRTKQRFTKRKARLISVLIWTYSSMFALPPLLGLVNRYVPEGFLTSCTFDYLSRDFTNRMYIFVFFLGAYVLPMFLIVFSYVRILINVRSSRKKFEAGMAKGPSSNFEQSTIGSEVRSPSSQGHVHPRLESALSSSSRSGKQKNRLELKLAVCAVKLISLWTIAWTPYAIVALVGIWGPREWLTPAMSMYPALFAKCAAFVDPYVYGYSHPKFRQEFARRFDRFWGRGHEFERGRKSRLSRFASFTFTFSQNGSRRGSQELEKKKGSMRMEFEEVQSSPMSSAASHVRTGSKMSSASNGNVETMV